MRQAGPQHAGYRATVWTVAMPAWALLHRLGVPLSTRALRDGLRARGLRWGRSRLAMPLKGAPAQARIPWPIAQAVVEAGPAAAILSADASRRQLLPLVRALWHRVGQPGPIPTPGTHVPRALFGALKRRRGRWGYPVRERLRPAEFLAFLAPLWDAYPQGPILRMGDNVSRHTAQAVGPWLMAPPRVPLDSWPTYGSPLNPGERIWRQRKNPWAAKRWYSSRPCLWETVEALFTAMTPAQA